MLHLDPERPITPPRDAATVLVIRAGQRAPDTIEVFCVRRHAQSAFLGGAVVFPGGKLDTEDGAAIWRTRCNGTHPRSLTFASDEAHAHALAVCACREVLEEAALLRTNPLVDGVDAESWQAQLNRKEASFGTLLGDRVLDIEALVPFARWVTPRAEQRRYDTRFFVLAAPPDQDGRHDDRETTSSVWATPTDMLAAFESGAVMLAPPTLRAFELLADVPDVDGAVALCAQQSLLPICPTFVPGDTPMLTIPGDPLHDVPERRVAGGTRFVLHDGRFVSREA